MERERGLGTIYLPEWEEIRARRERAFKQAVSFRNFAYASIALACICRDPIFLVPTLAFSLVAVKCFEMSGPQEDPRSKSS